MSVLLLSGGMDSTLCLHLCKPSLAVGVDYGQPHRIELTYAANIARRYGVQYDVLHLPSLQKTDDIVFAGRNAMLLSLAASVAQSKGLSEVVIGVNKTDSSRFPDCRPDFINAMSRAFLSAYGVSIATPLLSVTKDEIVSQCASMGIADTWTCYFPTERNEPCGCCFSCLSVKGSK